MPVLPPTTGAPLNLYVPPFDYGTGPNDFTWDVPANDNWVALNNFASSVVLLAPAATQTIVQPPSTFFNVNSPLFYAGANPAIRFGLAASAWDSAITRIGAGTFTIDANTAGAAGGTLKAFSYNATRGYQQNGVAPSNYLLVGDGQYFVANAKLPVGAANYQKTEFNTAPLTGRNILNILTPLTAVDDAGNGSTDIGHRTVSANPSNYVNASLTIDQWGHVTAAASGGGITATVANVTADRTTGVIYQNIGLNPIYISGNANSNTGMSTCNIGVRIGPTSPPTMAVWTAEFGATVANGSLPFSALVPAGWFHELVVAGDAGWGGSSLWYETQLS